IRCWKHLSRFRQEIKFSTWLYRITLNGCLDLLKSSSYKRRTAMQSVENEPVIAYSQTPLTIIQEKEFMDLVLKKSTELTPKQRAVFVLRDLEDMSVDEISIILSMSAGNIKSNLYYARKKMSESLATFRN